MGMGMGGSVSMFVPPSLPSSSLATSTLPLLQHHPHHQQQHYNTPLPPPRPRAISAGFDFSKDKDSTPDNSFTSDKIQELFSRFPASFIAATQKRRRGPTKTTTGTTSTTTSTTTTTPTTTTTTTPSPKHHRESARTGAPMFVSQFHSDGVMSGDKHIGIGGGGDDAVVLLVGVFNLLAVLVYAAHQYVKGTPGGLSERVIQWQVQKVLDELVIKVHSSQYLANMLSRALPTHHHSDDLSTWQPLLEHIQRLVEGNSSEARTWLGVAKSRVMTEVAASPAALNTVRLHPAIYQPLRRFYTSLVNGNTAPLHHLLEAAGGRALGPHPARALVSLLPSLSQVSLQQVRSTMAALTSLGRAQQRVDVVPLLAQALRHSSQPIHQARNMKQSVPSSSQMSRLKHVLTPIQSRRTLPTSRTHRWREERVMRREGKVDDEHALGTTASGHWTDRWFSLVTQLAPVGLDISTLYARSRARPKCLRALLCRANNAWRQVGPVQAALTPLASVLVSWSLEEIAPHSLGDSLIAVRAGWMGKDCTHLYPECPLRPDPHPAAKEAITFFSRLQYVATQPPEIEPPQEPNPPPNFSHDPTTNNRVDRIDSPLFYDDSPTQDKHKPTHPHRFSGPLLPGSTGQVGNEYKTGPPRVPSRYPSTYHNQPNSNQPSTYHNQPSSQSHTSHNQPPSHPHTSHNRSPSHPHNQPPSNPHNQPPSHPHNQPPNHPHNQPPSHSHNQPPNHPHNQPPSNPHNQPPSHQHTSPSDDHYHSHHHQQLLPHSQQPAEDSMAAAASFQAYYDRYGGQGPMLVPGSTYTDKYGHQNESAGGPERPYESYKPMGTHANNPNKPYTALYDNPGKLYDKYDSPAETLTVTGAISDSNSVSGMALQDPPIATRPQVWEKFFKAGLYGSNVQQSAMVDKMKPTNRVDVGKVSLLPVGPQQQTQQHQHKPPSTTTSSSSNKMGVLVPNPRHKHYTLNNSHTNKNNHNTRPYNNNRNDRTNHNTYPNNNNNNNNNQDSDSRPFNKNHNNDHTNHNTYHNNHSTTRPVNQAHPSPGARPTNRPAGRPYFMLRPMDKNQQQHQQKQQQQQQQQKHHQHQQQKHQQQQQQQKHQPQQHKHQTLAGSVTSSSVVQFPGSHQMVKKYRYGLRRGLPAGNVNNNNYNSFGNSIAYEPHRNTINNNKPWFAFTAPPRYTSPTPITPSPITTTTPSPPTITTPTAPTTTTTLGLLHSKDIDPFGPEDAVTDVLRNELLFEFIRDRQGSVTEDDKRSLT
ncbi:hypothetical protein Pmani_022648 [Petrolisthes manimaculis]|uniref:Uncharacterized protein n=1 Tax=Petrolisthes manimaculis TaxID=1843537 RepID=A0AAE1PDX0_9EUCA|nr:hypothetical protein Pmani_022648 [Petrolisthes manimaculis]